MLYIVSDPSLYTMHETGQGHPEQPARVEIIDSTLFKGGIKTLENTLSPRLATKKEVTLCHTPSYFEVVRYEVSNLLNSEKTSILSTGDTPISSHSLETALLAVGGVLSAVDQVMTRPRSKVFCVVRPPGHHACLAKGMGFCIFNNAAIAARYAQQSYGVQRVLIADWDVHHGNGTQDIFYQDPTVFYFSTHEQGLYPGTGAAEEKGEGLGLGFTMNCPILPGRQSRLQVVEAFRTLLVEQMKAFQPNLVIVSAGFDAHEGDPLGHFNLTDGDFSTLTSIVNAIADEYAEGRLISILEGGYHLNSLASASLAHAKAIR